MSVTRSFKAFGLAAITVVLLGSTLPVRAQAPNFPDGPG
jgi:hypothetical protein